MLQTSVVIREFRLFLGQCGVFVQKGFFSSDCFSYSTQYILFPTIADNPVIRSGYPPRILHLLDLVGPGKNGGGMNCLESKPRTPVLRSRNQSEPTFLVRRQSRNLKAAPAPPKKQTKKCFTLQQISTKLQPAHTGSNWLHSKGSLKLRSALSGFNNWLREALTGLNQLKSWLKTAPIDFGPEILLSFIAPNEGPSEA